MTPDHLHRGRRRPGGVRGPATALTSVDRRPSTGPPFGLQRPRGGASRRPPGPAGEGVRVTDVSETTREARRPGPRRPTHARPGTGTRTRRPSRGRASLTPRAPTAPARLGVTPRRGRAPRATASGPRAAYPPSRETSPATPRGAPRRQGRRFGFGAGAGGR